MTYNKLIKGIGIILLYILMPGVLDMFFPSITASTTTELLGRFSILFLLLLFYIYLYKDDIIRDIKAMQKSGLSILRKSVIYFVILLIGVTVISALIHILIKDFEYTNSSIINTLLQDNFFIMIFYVFIISLFTEQIVFRKVFKDILNNKYFFVIFSGLIYGIFQIGYNISSLNDVFSIIPFAYAGIILSVSYEKTDNIFTPCLVYFFYDLFLLLI